MATSLNTGLVALVRSSLGIDPAEAVVLAFRKGHNILGTVSAELVQTGDWTKWLAILEQIVIEVTDADELDGSFLVIFDENDVFRGEAYREASILLSRHGIPVNHAVLVADGKVMDYFGDRSDAVDYAEVLKTDIALEDMLTVKNRRRAQDVNPCEESSMAVMSTAVARMAELENREHENVADASAELSHELATTIADYAENGKVTEEIAGWIAGTFMSAVGRDLAVAGLAGVANGTEDLREIYLGQRAIEDREIFEAGANMLHESLTLIAGTKPRAGILCALGWSHWVTGNMTQAFAMLDLALEEEPQHSLATGLRTLMLNLGIPKSAYGK
ncbi:DUF4192 family protein [Glutamicibacter sp. ZJUTW]|uniref:DUF4192 family protein n=1 Tax=Glutamicibacter sp. ZJUTW TaxID=1155384 RepID=UPI0011F26303|nr:DUF4192 family protein [Glutamicibacter sp. ZJUTW]QEP09080.1 DUF4192 family protein [Glutamicibacter sp. ZJUTW]